MLAKLQESSPVVFVGVAVGAFLGYAVAQLAFSRRQLAPITASGAAAASEPAALPEVPPGELKMVLIARSDLKMKPGKTAAQCGHATLGAYKRSLRRKPEYVAAWEERAQAKVALKVDSEELMDRIATAANEAGLVTYVVTDAGRTQIPEGSRTVLAIGPAPVAEIDAITGRAGMFPLSLMN